MLNRNRCQKSAVILLLISLLGTALPVIAQQKNLPDWAFGPFIRPKGINPILSPQPASRFLDPMSKKEIAWEANDVFNPAATIKGDKVYVLYRAEDKSGVAIGTRTSR
ncbi:MAG TPA: hypothetical protein VLJ41_11120, partial [Segetibacter sp.]|nr:hypothetical protein [Segetibacter sp.]